MFILQLTIGLLCCLLLFASEKVGEKYLCYDKIANETRADRLVCTFNAEIFLTIPMIYVILPFETFRRPMDVFSQLCNFLCTIEVTCNYHDYMQLQSSMLRKVTQLQIPFFRFEHYYTLYLFHMNQLRKHIERWRVGAYNNAFVNYTQTKLPLRLFRWTKETSVSIIISGDPCFDSDVCVYNMNSFPMVNLVEQLTGDLTELVDLAKVQLLYGYAFPHSDEAHFGSNCISFKQYFEQAFPGQEDLVVHCYGRFLPLQYNSTYLYYDLREEIARYAYETFQSDFYILLDPTVTLFPPLWLAGMIQSLLMSGIQPGVGVGFTGCMQLQLHADLLREDPTLPTVYPIIPTLTKAHFELFFPLSDSTLSNPQFPEILNNLLFYDVYQSFDAVFCSDRKYLKDYTKILLPMYRENVEDYIDHLQLARYQILSRQSSLQPIADWLEERMSFFQYQDSLQILYCNQVANGCTQEYPLRTNSGMLKVSVVENVALRSEAYGHIPSLIIGSSVDTVTRQILFDSYFTKPIPISNDDEMSMYANDDSVNAKNFLQNISRSMLQSLLATERRNSHCTSIKSSVVNSGNNATQHDAFNKTCHVVESAFLTSDEVMKVEEIVSNRTYTWKEYSRIYPPWNVFRKKASTKVAVITAIFGGYEISCKPFAQQTVATDFYCFTDRKDIRSNGWIVDTTPYHLDALRYEFDHHDPTSGESLIHELNALHNNQHPFNIAKYYKLNFHAIPILQSYDIVVWIDGTIRITDPNTIKKVVEIIYEEEKDIVVFEHLRQGNVTLEGFLSRYMIRYANTEVRGYFQPRQEIANQIEVYYGRQPNISKTYIYSDHYWKELSYKHAYKIWEQAMHIEDPVRLVQLEHYLKVGFCPALRTYMHSEYESEYFVQEMFGFDVNTVRAEYGLWCTCFVAFHMRSIETLTTNFSSANITKSISRKISKASKFLDMWSAHNRKYSTQDQISFPYVSQILQIHPQSLPYRDIYGSYVYNTLFVKTEHGLR